MVRKLEGTPSLSKTQKRVTGEVKSPTRLPFSDDGEEKSRRLQTRTGLNDAHMASIIATSSPKKVLRPYDRAVSGSPSVAPNRLTSARHLQSEAKSTQIFGDGSPAKRIPILANFEEWMKMATDNKINATNSWNFALIDYFHDLSLLKEGESVNFQKASCTLDGCVKIYTNRVDSVATETGKLLSGLSENKSAQDVGSKESDDEDASDQETDSQAAVHSKKAARKVAVAEATIAPSFASLSLKKFDLEFSIDPLFKKASADFDEGGAKGLLLNNLAINNHGRICFDSCSDAENGELIHKEASASDTTQGSSLLSLPKDIDLSSLRDKVFPNFVDLDLHHLSAVTEEFILGENDVQYDMRGVKKRESEPPTAASLQSIPVLGDDALNLDLSTIPDFLIPESEDYGTGGDEWLGDQKHGTWAAPDSAVSDPAYDNLRDSSVHASSNSVFTLQKTQDHQLVLDYFDDKLISNWAGPEHWKVERLKAIKKPGDSAAIPRKVREPFEIDFLGDAGSSFEDLRASQSNAITLPKSQWQSAARNLLPDDERFASTQLLRLFTKPKARLMRQNGTWRRRLASDRVVDAAHMSQTKPPACDDQNTSNDQVAFNHADFFMGMDPLVTSEADVHGSLDLEGKLRGGISEDSGLQFNGSSAERDRFGDQLLTSGARVRAEYVQYARQAKKVDVRRLKEELWQGLSDGQAQHETLVGKAQTPAFEKGSTSETDNGRDVKRFTSVINSLQDVYDDSTMADISTSYCFICLLHLANEKGLTIQGDESLEELSIDTRVGSYMAAENT